MSLGDIYPTILTIVLTGILLGIGLVILGTLQASSTLVNQNLGYGANSSAVNALNQTMIGLGTFATWIPIIVLVIAAAIVIGLVVNSFRNKQG